MTPRVGDDGIEQLTRTLRTVQRNDGLERLDPLPRLSWVYVDKFGHDIDGS
jgi:hypothetical protein